MFEKLLAFCSNVANSRQRAPYRSWCWKKSLSRMQNCIPKKFLLLVLLSRGVDRHSLKQNLAIQQSFPPSLEPSGGPKFRLVRPSSPASAARANFANRTRNRHKPLESESSFLLRRWWRNTTQKGEGAQLWSLHKEETFSLHDVTPPNTMLQNAAHNCSSVRPPKVQKKYISRASWT